MIVKPLLQNLFLKIFGWLFPIVFWGGGNVSVLCCGAERIANEKYFLQQRGGWVVHSAQLTVSNSHSPLLRRILDHSHHVAGSKQDEGNPYLVCWSVVNHKKLIIPKLTWLQRIFWSLPVYFVPGYLIIDCVLNLDERMFVLIPIPIFLVQRHNNNLSVSKTPHFSVAILKHNWASALQIALENIYWC